MLSLLSCSNIVSLNVLMVIIFVPVPVVRVMQQIYDTWLTTLTTNNPQTDGALLTQRVQGEKYIVMPTDNAEPMVGRRCYLHNLPH